MAKETHIPMAQHYLMLAAMFEGLAREARVAAARATRDRVRVDGKEYRSFHAACVALKVPLPVNKIERLRAQCKKAGSVVVGKHVIALADDEPLTSDYRDEQRIKVLGEFKGRKGKKPARLFELVKQSPTVGDYRAARVKAGIRPRTGGYLRHFVNKGLVAIR